MHSHRSITKQTQEEGLTPTTTFDCGESMVLQKVAASIYGNADVQQCRCCAKHGKQLCNAHLDTEG